MRAFHYGCHLAAELLVKKGVGERSPERRKSGDASFEIAYVVVALLSDPGFAGRGAFMEHVRARFHAVCPQTCPGLKAALLKRGACKVAGHTANMKRAANAGCTTCKALLKRFGFIFMWKGKKNEGQTRQELIEPQSRHDDRMNAYVAFYAAITQTDPVGRFLRYRGQPFPDPNAGARNPLGHAHAWTWLARTLNQTPPRATTPGLVRAFLGVAGNTLMGQGSGFAKQLKKLVVCIQNDWLKKFKQDDPAVMMFFDDIKKCFKQNTWPKPGMRTMKDGREVFEFTSEGQLKSPTANARGARRGGNVAWARRTYGSFAGNAPKVPGASA